MPASSRQSVNDRLAAADAPAARDGLAAHLSERAPAHGFEVHREVVELSGVCAACRTGPPPSLPSPALRAP